jgi:hypothetical protein
MFYYGTGTYLIYLTTNFFPWPHKCPVRILNGTRIRSDLLDPDPVRNSELRIRSRKKYLRIHDSGTYIVSSTFLGSTYLVQIGGVSPLVIRCMWYGLAIFITYVTGRDIIFFPSLNSTCKSCQPILYKIRGKPLS